MAATSAHVLARLWQTAIQILRTLQRLVNTIRAPTDALASVFCQKCLEPPVVAVLHRVPLARTTSGVDSGVALGALPFEERRSNKRSGVWGTAADSDVLGGRPDRAQVFAGRDRDWDDLRGVLARKHGQIDWTIIRHELPPLLELQETPEAMQRLDEIAADVTRRPT